MEPILLVIVAVAVLLIFKLIRRSEGELEHLRAGYVPPSWEAAYRRAHPDGSTGIETTS